MSHSRRTFLKTAAKASTAALVLGALPIPAMAVSGQTQAKKVVWVMLRGALDPLHTVIPFNDKTLISYRPTLFNKSLEGALPLDDTFKLNSAMVNLHTWYQQKQLLPVVATSSGYGGRSHFDGQDYLESGLKVTDHDSGWLARVSDTEQQGAIAIAQSVPISLRSLNNVKSWYPNKLKDAEDDLITKLMSMYESDQKLQENLSQALSLDDMAMAAPAKGSKQFVELAKSCGNFLSGSNEVNVATLELGGWDTHNNQHNRLNRQLKTLDNGLAALKASLIDHWQDTLVIVASEFGRTVRENGTNGTDHGTGGLMLLAGGSVNGGRVEGNWPGLAENNLFENRDLKPTTNALSWIASALKQHWSLSDSQLNQAFPSYSHYKSVKVVNA